MNDLVKIRFRGQCEPLKNKTFRISPELVTDGHVYALARLDIENAMSEEIPEYDSLVLPEDLWTLLRLGDREFLLYWEVVMKPQ